MTRRLALACSFALTIVVSVAVASFASQAGWLATTSQSAEADALTEVYEPTTEVIEAAVVAEPQIVTDYVYVDVPVVRKVQVVLPAPADTVAANPTATAAATSEPVAAPTLLAIVDDSGSDDSSSSRSSSNRATSGSSSSSSNDDSDDRDDDEDSDRDDDDSDYGDSEDDSDDRDSDRDEEDD